MRINKQNQQVLAFGVFDPLHKGHEYFLKRARELGNSLLVVVARDSYIRTVKEREPVINEELRRRRVMELKWVDEVILGKEWPTEDHYRLLKQLPFDVLALGYDQKPDDDQVKKELDRIGRKNVTVIRLQPFRPDKYKSSLMKSGAK